MAEYRAHERAFGVELARNLRKARERIGLVERQAVEHHLAIAKAEPVDRHYGASDGPGFGRGPPLHRGGQVGRAGLEGGAFGFQGLARGLGLEVGIGSAGNLDRDDQFGGWRMGIRCS